MRNAGKKTARQRHGVAIRTLAIVLAMAAHTQAAHAVSDDAVATVNGVPLHRIAVDEALIAAGQQDTPAARQQIVRGLVARELIRQAAERDALGNTEVVRQAVRKAKVDTENRLYVAQHLQPRPVTDAQVRERYEAIVSEAGSDEYQVSVMTLADEPAARFALTRVRAGEPFAKVAAQMGVVAQGDGVPRWVTFPTPAVEGHTQGLPLPLAQALPTMNAGEVTPEAIAAAGRYVVARLEARRPMAIPSYDAVRESLRASLEAQQRDDAFIALVDRLAAKAVIRPRHAASAVQ
ncbi:peptidylprolyl isomerase [Burkholderia sola]|uniref:peptidylprolyl isomerase n=1 Tax=Burkholderia sola TaxID=2843302 RepID=UPI0023DDCBB6|nr:peptidylprolyl isomerase [Burkholderia sola]MDF3084890.1 peptidylprolyl isomerase [Burkholderia sola]